MDEGRGLRERKKAATRRALHDAALRLAIADGVEHVTAEAIAAAADVCARTFHNYFGSKEEAIAAALAEQTRALAAELSGRPPGEPLWDAVTAVTLHRFAGTPAALADGVAVKRLLRESPALRAHHYQVTADSERLLAEVVAARTGTDVDTDLYPRLVIAVVSSAARAALQMWSGGRGGADSPAALLADALRQVRSGLPEPAPT